jgi:hypothetical protein
MTKENKLIIVLLILLISNSFVFAESSMNFLSKGFADTLYCWKDGTNCPVLGNISYNYWNITGSKYLINSSNILDVNETMLNATIDARSVGGSDCSAIGSCVNIIYLDYSPERDYPPTEALFYGKDDASASQKTHDLMFKHSDGRKDGSTLIINRYDLPRQHKYYLPNNSPQQQEPILINV